MYIAWRRGRALDLVKRRPIYELCRATKRASGTPQQLRFWWGQDLGGWIDVEEDADAPSLDEVEGD